MTEKIKDTVESIKTEILNRIDEIKENRNKNRAKRYIRGIVKAICAPLIPIIGIDTYRNIMNEVDEYAEAFYHLAVDTVTDSE